MRSTILLPSDFVKELASAPAPHINLICRNAFRSVTTSFQLWTVCEQLEGCVKESVALRVVVCRYQSLQRFWAAQLVQSRNKVRLKTHQRQRAAVIAIRDQQQQHGQVSVLPHKCKLTPFPQRHSSKIPLQTIKYNPQLSPFLLQ